MHGNVEQPVAVEQHEGQRRQPAGQHAHAEFAERHADGGCGLGEVVVLVAVREPRIDVLRRDEDQREREEPAHGPHDR